MRRRFPLFILLAALAVFGYTRSVQAATYSRATQLAIPDTNTTIDLFPGQTVTGATVATADLNNDGQDEYVVGAGAGYAPWINVVDSNGNVLARWLAYDATMKGGVNVAVGDLNNDGRMMVVTAPQGDAPPVIKEFLPDGTFVFAFKAFPSQYHEGANIDVLEATSQNAARIVIGTRGVRKNEVRLFAADGHLTSRWMTDVAGKAQTGVTVSAGWSASWGEPVVVIGAGRDSQPRVSVFGLRSHRTLASWLAFRPTTKTGVTVSYLNGQVAVAPQGLGQPTVRLFNDGGALNGQVAVFEKTFLGGLSISQITIDGQPHVVAVPTSTSPSTAAVDSKEIRVNLTSQTLQMVENGVVISTRRISSGKWSTPTPVGTYKTRNKIPVAYSTPFHLYMEWWMAITPDGQYGLHALPFWKLKNGGKLYEGAAHIGTPVSHGCVRQTVAEAKSLYDWAPVGTPVIITK